MTPKEKEILKIYKNYWITYFSRGKGVKEKVFSNFHPDADGIGTGKDEIVKSSEELKKYIDREFEEVTETLPVNFIWSDVSVYDSVAVGNGEIEIIINPEKNLRMRVRNYLVFKKHYGNWKVVHLHVSLPAAGQAEDESFPLDALKAQKEKLEKEVAEKTADLRSKNRELEIEAALERVRAKTMAMQKSEELKEVIQVVYEQFVQLNIHIEHTGFIMDYKARDDMHIWLADQNGAPSQITIPYFDSPHWNSFNEAKEKGMDFFANNLPFEEKNRFYKKLFKYIPGLPEEAKEFYLSCPGLAISTVLLENVGLYIENFSGIAYSDEENNTLMRFGKVFQQTYTRFNDLQKAEAQAREAQIEAVLERVRTRSMAMHKSDELAEVATVLYQELTELEIRDFINCGFVEVDVKEKAQHGWSTMPDGSIAEGYYLPLAGDPVLKKRYLAWKKKAPVFQQSIGGKDLKKHMAFVFKTLGSEEVKEMTQRFFPDPTIFYCFNFNHGYLHIITDKVIEEGNEKILLRFAKAFEQTYTRFLDLQKAEAQVREAQIEAALERVRSRSLAMHKSEELVEVATVLYKQLRLLDVREFSDASIVIVDESNNQQIVWGARTESDFLEKAVMPLLGDQILQKIYDKWRLQDAFFTLKVEGIALQKHLNFVIPKAGRTEIEDRALKNMPDPTFFHCAVFSMGYLELMADKELSKDSSFLLTRFAKVFEQTYTRFLDLEKAEAQAREAQIEAALERVRSRSMAMHKSDELQEVSNRLVIEMLSLGLQTKVCYIVTDLDEDITKGLYIWVQNDELLYAEKMYLPYLDHPMFHNFYKAWKEKTPFYTEIFTKKEKNRLFNHFFKHSPQLMAIPEERKKYILAGAGFPRSVCISKNAAFVIQKYDDKPFEAEEINIQKRFGQVFEQTYTRFLDLQKAEAQAREAQIEAALERIRTKAMAMHNSEDISDATAIVFSELEKLGIATFRCGIAIHVETTYLDVWTATSSANKDDSRVIGQLDMSIHPMLQSTLDAWKKKKPFYSHKLVGDNVKNYYSAIAAAPDYPLPRPKKIPTRLSLATFNFKEGLLFFISEESITEETAKIFKRFTSVFALTYRRFLDLKNAEAQAREAKIETALERVRSKAMAMHNSNDLPSTASIVFTELRNLGITSIRSGVGLLTKETRKAILYAATSSGVGDNLSLVGWAMLENHPILLEMYDCWTRNEDYFPIMKGEMLKTYYEQILSNFAVPGSHYKQNLPGNSTNNTPSDYTQYGHFLAFSKGFLYGWKEEPYNENEASILKRFAAVIDLTFKRYFDLQTAETNAEEAQIEVALERVRSRTMAMHQSDELAETAAVVFKQLMNLGIEPNRIYLGIIKDQKGTGEFWITDEDGSKVSKGFTANLNDNSSFKKIYAGWKEQKKSITIDMKGKELQAYFKHLSSLGVPFKGGLSQKRRMQYIAYFSQGFIGVASADETKPETLQLLERFAAVYNLTNTRFNDLQQAEAQNKIIQAENERKTKELEEARQLQLSMLPKELPQLPHLDIAVYMKTATEVGGDFYDFSTNEDSSLNIAIGDATGHGMKASIMVSSMKSIFTTNSSKMNIESFFTTANNGVKSMGLKRMMMGFIMVNIQENKLKLINAGMPPVFLFRKKSRSVEEIMEHGMPIGAMSLSQYIVTKQVLEKGDVLLLMSDGMPELHNDKNEMYGYGRIHNGFEKVAGKSPENIISYLKNEGASWVNNEDPDDDVTFVVIKVK